MDISVTLVILLTSDFLCGFLMFFLREAYLKFVIYITDLRFSVWILNVLLEGSVSQICYLGPSFHFMTKNG